MITQHQNINFFDKCFIDFLKNLPEENKKEKTSNIKEIFNTHSKTFISELLTYPNEKEPYLWIQKRLSQIDSQLLKEFDASIEKIQKIARALKNSPRTLTYFETLKLPRDLHQVRSIIDSDLKAFVMANLYERDKISLSKFSKEELIAMGPHLKTLNFKGTEDWDIQDVCDILEASPNLKELEIHHPKIESFPPLDFCEKLDCSNCKGLKQLPILLKCCTLICNGCSELIVIPELSNCQKLFCNQCLKLEEIAGLPNCLELFCESSLILKKLPALPLCQKLYCNSCSLLQELPPLPNCIKLYCNRCLALTEFPPLPNCKELFCNGCPKLNFLPMLFQCDNLDCDNCRSLDRNTIPRRFREEDSPFENEALPEIQAMQIRIEEINNNPLKILLEAGEYLLQGKGIPSIKFIETIDLASEGVDQGGLSKIFVTKIIEGLLSNSETQEQLSFDQDPQSMSFMPFIQSEVENLEDQKKGFRIIGALLAECIFKGYFIDRVFHLSFFHAITSLSSQELDTMPENIEDLPRELRLRLFNILYKDDVSSILQKSPKELTFEENHVLIKFIASFHDEQKDNAPYSINSQWFFDEASLIYLNEKKARDVLLPLVLIAKQMHSSLLLKRDCTWEQLRKLGGESFQQKMEGILNPQFVFKSILWDRSRISEADGLKTKGFVEKWMNEASSQDLRNLVYTITGLPSLSRHSILKFELFNRGKMNIPKAQTCFNSLDLSADYPDYATFKPKLELLINSSINKEESGIGLT